MHKAIRANPFLTYPKRSIDMGGEEGGVCMDPAMVKEELAQWGLWWSPFNLSGGVNMPPPPSVILKKCFWYFNFLALGNSKDEISMDFLSFMFTF